VGDDRDDPGRHPSEEKGTDPGRRALGLWLRWRLPAHPFGS
jgi:hypothetical protein